MEPPHKRRKLNEQHFSTSMAPSSTDGTLSNQNSVPNGNSVPNDNPVPNDGAFSEFDHAELIRIIVQSLHALNYDKVAANLQEASGVALHEAEIAQFRNHILSGQYAKVLELKDEQLKDLLKLSQNAHVQKVKMLILKQLYLELLEADNINDALVVLRKEISPILQHSSSEILHHLASLMLCDGIHDLYERANWSGSKGSSRMELMNEIQTFVDPHLLIPENRLETLLHQAVEYQKDRYGVMQNPLHHNPLHGVSLLQREVPPETAVPNKTIATLTDHKDEVWNIQFSHSGDYLATVGTDKLCFIYKVNNFDGPVHTFSGSSSALSTVSWSPDDKYVLVISHGREAKIWDCKQGSCVATFEDCSSAFWFPNSKHIMCAGGSNDRHIFKYDIHTKEKLHEDTLPFSVQEMDMSCDGTRLVVVNGTKKLHVYYPGDMEHHYELSENDFISSVKISPCGRYALVNISLESSSKKDSRISLWDLVDKKKVRTYEGIIQSRFVLRSTFGGNNACFVVSGSESNEVLVWKRSDGKLITRLSGHTKSVGSVACNPRYTSMFASASDDRTVRIYDVGNRHQE